MPILTVPAKFKIHISPVKTLITVIVLGLTIFAYFNFVSYRPKVLKQVAEINGYKTQDSMFNLPNMTGTKEIGSSNTNNGRQITLEVNKAPDDVRNFYKNVFLDKGWKLSASSNDNKSLVDEYRQGKYDATVIISKEDVISNTVIGINITKAD